MRIPHSSKWVTMCRTPRMTVTRNHIRHVVRLGPKQHVPRIHVVPHIIAMADYQSIGYGFAKQFVSDTVRPKDAPAKSKCTIAVLVESPTPRPHNPHCRWTARHPVAKRFLQTQTRWAPIPDRSTTLRITIGAPSLVMGLAPSTPVTGFAFASRDRADSIAHVDSLLVGHAPGPLTRSPGSRSRITA